ncbi:hypothetical protein HD806DRAFT_538143 [Xylariaceae sp. AK1471]|nr:hypothetical protein HD806DRAFT_538143 [Xylariaceae sp. AK1471]
MSPITIQVGESTPRGSSTDIRSGSRIFSGDIEVIDGEDVDVAELFTQNAGEIKKTLIEVAETCVPPKAGDRLANLVYRCPTCLGPIPVCGGSQFYDGDDKNPTSEVFSKETFSNLNKVSESLEVTGATRTSERKPNAARPAVR